MSLDEFDLFLTRTYLYLFGNKRVKYKLSFFLIFLMDFTCLLVHRPYVLDIFLTQLISSA